MLDQAQKMRANWQTGKSGGGQNDRLYTKKQADKELHAFVQRMVENAVNQKKRKAGTVHFADKMPSKDDDDDSDDEKELNQFESLSINGADDNEESSSDSSNN